MDTFVGFDSAWIDAPATPGAICAIQGPTADGPASFVAPELVSFQQALGFVRQVASPTGLTLVGMDQPTIVPNASGSRPVDRVSASVVSWLGGGVQPANRGKKGMFCDASPIWRFLDALGAIQDPELARQAGSGLFLMEVFPALALPSLDDAFCRRHGAAKYNPLNRRLFRLDDWSRVGAAAAREAHRLGCAHAALWCEAHARLERPRKADQDRLDAVLCALTAMRWRADRRDLSVYVGDLVAGYMVAPVTNKIRERLASAARRLMVQRGLCVRIDGAYPDI